MKIYNSNNLTITHRDDMLIQEWITNNLSVEDFQTELKTYLSFYEKVRPKSVLWLQENFKLQIPPNLYHWIENDIVKRQYETGMQNLGFTVSADMMSHLSVMASFEKVQSVIQPNFFTNRNIAIDFLDKEVKRKNELEFKIMQQGDIAKIDVTLGMNLLPKVVSTLKNIEKEQRFINNNLRNIQSLTPREMEIFKMIVNGYCSKEVANTLFITNETVKTHRKNIIKKLQIKKSVDWFLIAKAFDLFD